MDLRHLMIGKAEDLTQDFDRVFAEQRRARHHVGLSDILMGCRPTGTCHARMIDLDHGAGGAQ